MEIGTWILKAILILSTSYAIGCLNTAYYLVRFRTGKDLRTLGSGNLGGRNAARTLGKWAFAFIFILDHARGALALFIATQIGLGIPGLLLSLHAVLLGHLYPIQLDFKGGKGIIVGGGILLMLNYKILLFICLLFVIPFAITRSFTLSGLLSVATAPIQAFLFKMDDLLIWGILSGMLLIWFAHRENLREIIRSYSSDNIQ